MYSNRKFIKTASSIAEIFKQINLEHLASIHGETKILNLIANRLVADAGVPINPSLIEIDYPIRSHIDSQCMLHIPEFSLYFSAHGASFDYDTAVAKVTASASIQPIEIYSRPYTKVVDYSLITPQTTEPSTNLLSEQFVVFKDLVDDYTQSLEEAVVQDVVEVLNESLKGCSQELTETINLHLDTVSGKAEIFEISSSSESGITIYAKKDYKLTTFNIFSQECEDGSNSTYITLRVEPTGSTSTTFAIERAKDRYAFESIVLNNPCDNRIEAIVDYALFDFYIAEVAKYLQQHSTMPEGDSVRQLFEYGRTAEICKNIDLTKDRALAILNSPDSAEGLEDFIKYYDSKQRLYELSIIAEAYLSGCLSEEAQGAVMSVEKSQQFDDIMTAHALAAQLESMEPPAPSSSNFVEVDASLRMSL